MVQQCTFLADLNGSSGWGGLAASTGMQNAKNEVREKAAELGATHVVWNQTEAGWTPSSGARAYRCNPASAANPAPPKESGGSTP
jgi:hypothetical protein